MYVPFTAIIFSVERVSWKPRWFFWLSHTQTKKHIVHLAILLVTFFWDGKKTWPEIKGGFICELQRSGIKKGHFELNHLALAQVCSSSRGVIMFTKKKTWRLTAGTWKIDGFSIGISFSNWSPIFRFHVCLGPGGCKQQGSQRPRFLTSWISGWN